MKISILPKAGDENPYQKLMINGLLASGLDAENGEPGKFFGLLMTAVKNRPDYIHLDWLHSYYARRKEWMTWVQFPFFIFQIFVVKKIFRIKFAWTLHNIFPHDQPTYGPYKWARQYFANQCEWLRVFDEDTIPRASEVLKVSSNKFIVVPEGSYVDYYTNCINQTDARKHLHLPFDKRILLYLGLIKPYKGVLELVKAFNESQLQNTILLIAGKSMDSNYFDKIKSISNDPNILIHEGFISDDDLQYYFNSSDIAVLPFNRIENSGSAILAMGFKKPIISPRTGVIKNRLSLQDMLLYEDGGLKKSLQKADLMDSEQLQRLGEKNYTALREHAWEDFSSCFYANKSLQNIRIS